MQFTKFNYQIATSHFDWTIFLSVLSLKKAIPNVKGPSLPKNIVTVKIIFATVDNVDVIPRLKPSLFFFSGKDAVTISKRLGPAKVSTTTDIYSK